MNSTAAIKIKATTQGLHEEIKNIVRDEIRLLPEMLEQLEPKDRIKILLQLLPYATPKIETVATNYGEPCEWTL